MSKWYLVLGGADAERLAFSAVMLVSGVMTAGYLFPVVFRAFLRPLPEGVVAPGGLRGEASPMMVVPLALTALVGLVLGLGDVFGVFQLASDNAASVMGVGP